MSSKKIIKLEELPERLREQIKDYLRFLEVSKRYHDFNVEHCGYGEYCPISEMTINYDSATINITVSKEPALKDGDYIFSDWEGGSVIGILKGAYNGVNCFMCMYTYIEDRVVYKGYIGCANPRIDRYATKEERKQLDDALRKQGIKWNAEKKCIQDIWLERVEHGAVYYFITPAGDIGDTIERGDSIDSARFDLGNYFHTKQQAKYFFEEKIKPTYRKRK